MEASTEAAHSTTYSQHQEINNNYNNNNNNNNSNIKRKEKKEKRFSMWSPKSLVRAVEDVFVLNPSSKKSPSIIETPPTISNKTSTPNTNTNTNTNGGSFFSNLFRSASSVSSLEKKRNKKNKNQPVFRREVDENGKETTFVGRFQILNVVLGSGGNSVVHLGIDTLTGSKVAIKCIKTSRPKSKDSPSSGSSLTNETLMVKNIIHPNIYQFIEAYRTDEFVYAIFEYVEGKGLYDLVSQQGHLSEEEARLYFRQMLNSLDYLHINGILHNDVKLENTLINNKKEVKMIDFGHATYLLLGLAKKVHYSTLSYTSPEILMYEEATAKSDIWSLGVTLYVMVTGFFPFDKTNEEKTRTSIALGKYDESKMKDLSTDLKDLIEKMLKVDPSERISVVDIKHHPWFQSGLDYYPQTVVSS